MKNMERGGKKGGKERKELERSYEDLKGQFDEIATNESKENTQGKPK